MDDLPSKFGNEPINSNEPPTDDSSEELWSPPQISLGSVLFVAVACGFVLAFVRRYGIEIIVPAIFISLLVAFLFGCVRLVKLGKQTDDKDRPTHGTD